MVADRQLYNPLHQLWGGMKPQLMIPSPSYTDLEKHQLVYLHLERTASGEAESRLEASSHLQWQLRNCHICKRCESKGDVFSTKWHQGIVRLAATLLQVDWKDDVIKGVIFINAAKGF